MAAATASYGTEINENSSWGISFKIIHQKLAPQGTGAETGDGSSTDFAFDVGYLKKFKSDSPARKELSEIYARQLNLNEYITETLSLADQDLKESMDTEFLVFVDLQNKIQEDLRDINNTSNFKFEGDDKGINAAIEDAKNI